MRVWLFQLNFITILNHVKIRDRNWFLIIGFKREFGIHKDCQGKKYIFNDFGKICKYSKSINLIFCKMLKKNKKEKGPS